jgi:hypothetical protein
MTDLITQLHQDVDAVTSGRLLFRPVWSKPAFDDEGGWMLNAQEAGD